MLRRANAREKERSERKKKNVNTRPVAAERESARAGKMSFVGKMQKRRPREYFTNGSQPSRALSLLAQNFIENFFCRSRANGHDGDKSGPGVVIYCSCIFRLKPEIRRSFVSQRAAPGTVIKQARADQPTADTLSAHRHCASHALVVISPLVDSAIVNKHRRG